MSFTQYLASNLLDHIFTDGGYTPPTSLYVALSTTTPTESGGNFTEPSGNGYARVETTATDWNAATDADPSLKDNSVAIDFGSASGGSWGTVTYVGIYDAVTTGNLLMSGALDASKTIGDGDSAQFSAGDLDITLD